MDKITVTLNCSDMVALCEWLREPTTETRFTKDTPDVEREAKTALALCTGWTPIMQGELEGPFDELAWVKLRFKELPHQYRDIKDKELHLMVRDE